MGDLPKVNEICKEIEVTNHAVLRWILQTGADVSKRNRIKAVVAFGDEVRPKRKTAEVKKIIKHKKKARYFYRAPWVAVVADGAVLTVYQTHPDKWEKVE